MSDGVQTEQITRTRFADWEKTLSEHHATPVLVIGIGHDHTVGQIHVVTCQEVTTEHIVAFLRKALFDLMR